MSKTLTVATVVGARPQFIKASPVSRALEEAGLREILIHTGQHSDANMSEVFFKEMEIRPPNYFLGISGLSHGAMTGEMLKQIEGVLLKEKPDVVLVYGDTNSTLAGALAAAKLHIPVAHVEAGLRSFNMEMPEEINRALTDRVSKWLFCPTATAVQNLSAEGYKSPNYLIENVGDVMLDASLMFAERAHWPSEVPESLQGKPFVLCTLHRQESTDSPEVFRSLINALKNMSETMPVVWPVHPRAKKKMVEFGISTDKLITTSPLGYLEMLALLKSCKLVATDSGGLQKEAYFFQKPCLTLRSETEWVELVEIGANTICGTDGATAAVEFRRILDSAKLNLKSDLYGDGKSAKRIVDVIRDTV